MRRHRIQGQMKMRRDISVLLVAFAAAPLAGCGGGVINAYDGTVRADRDVAVLFTPKADSRDHGGSRAVLSGVGGRNYGTYMKGYPEVTRVLPGKFMVKVLCYDTSSGSRGLSRFLLFSADLEAGHYYELGCNLLTASYTDRGTDYNKIRDLLPESIQYQLSP